MIEFNATFIVAMLSFVVFIVIMNAIFYNPILGIIRKRDEYISSNYDDSKRFEATALEYRTTHQSKIEQVQNKCRHEFRQEIEQARGEATVKLNAARQNSKLAAQDKKDNLAKQAQDLKSDIKQTVVKDLASAIVAKFAGVDSNIANADYEAVNKVMN